MENRISKIAVSEILDQYNKIVADTLKLNFLVRDSDIQNTQSKELESFRLFLKRIKYQAIQNKNEGVANLIFQAQCVVNALKSSLQMWIELKSQNVDTAWDLLVDAQEYISVALRIKIESAWGISECAAHLTAIEKVIFPGWPYYLSPGILEEGAGVCSICQQLYVDCHEHIEGYVYWGRLCERINRKFTEAHHSALVESPKDKRCIIRYVSTEDGKKRDYITWRILDEKFSADSGDSSHMMIEGIMLTSRRLDLD